MVHGKHCTGLARLKLIRLDFSAAMTMLVLVLLSTGLAGIILKNAHDSQLATTVYDKDVGSVHDPATVPSTPPVDSAPHRYVPELHRALDMLRYDPLGSYTVTKAVSKLVGGMEYIFCLDYGNDVHVGVSLFLPAVGASVAQELTSSTMIETCLQPHTSVSLLEVQDSIDKVVKHPYRLGPGDQRYEDRLPLTYYNVFDRQPEEVRERILVQGVTDQDRTPLCTIHAAVTAASHRDMTMYSTTEMKMCAWDPLPYCNFFGRSVFFNDPEGLSLYVSDTFLALGSIATRGLVEESVSPSHALPGPLGYCLASNPRRTRAVLRCGHLPEIILDRHSLDIVVDYEYCKCPDASGIVSNYELNDSNKYLGVRFTRRYSCYFRYDLGQMEDIAPEEVHMMHTVPMSLCEYHRLAPDLDLVTFRLSYAVVSTTEGVCDATNVSPVYELLQCQGKVSDFIPPRATRRVDPVFCSPSCGGYPQGVTTTLSNQYCRVDLKSGREIFHTLELSRGVCSHLSPRSKARLGVYSTRLMDINIHQECPSALAHHSRTTQPPPIQKRHPSIRELQERIIESGSVVISIPVFNDWQAFFDDPDNAQRVYSGRTGTHYKTCSEATRLECDSPDSNNAYSEGHHAVVVYGWNFRCEEPHWLVQNSFGKLWADKGTFRLSVTTSIEDYYSIEIGCAKELDGAVVEEFLAGEESRCVVNSLDASKPLSLQYSPTHCQREPPERLLSPLRESRTEVSRATGCCLVHPPDQWSRLASVWSNARMHLEAFQTIM